MKIRDIFRGIRDSFGVPDRLARIENALIGLGRKVDYLNLGVEAMKLDVTALEAKVWQLEAKITEANATLSGLAQAALDSLSAAEDAADDQLPPTTP